MVIKYMVVYKIKKKNFETPRDVQTCPSTSNIRIFLILTLRPEGSIGKGIFTYRSMYQVILPVLTSVVFTYMDAVNDTIT